MAHEHLWQKEAFGKAFQRWWDEDWSWQGLAKKYRQESHGHRPDEALGTLQDVWREEQGRLIEFGGRKWTRFHLPPFDRDGNPCHETVWKKAKGPSCLKALTHLLQAAKPPGDEALQARDLEAVSDFADLQGVVLPEGFRFDGEVMVAHLASAIFLGSFAHSKRLLAVFGNATFSGAARFDGATFFGTAWFRGATFSGNARFEGATFSGDAEFGDATFSGAAVFVGTTFSGSAWFMDAAFSGDAWFARATFSETARFAGATFSKDAWFAGTTPFARPVSFHSVRFQRSADFSGREFKGRTDFGNARFAGVPKFHGAKLHPDTSFLDTKLRDGRKSRRLPPLRRAWFGWQKRPKTDEELARWKEQLRRWRISRWLQLRRFFPDMEKADSARNSDAEKYEIAYRQLRRLCAEIGSIEYEGMFHALELRAHRARTDTQLMARAASWAYEKLSDYGRSMGRPLLLLLIAWGLFATLYLLILTPPYSAEACAGVGWPSRLEILVAAAQEFLPSLFGAANISNQPEWLRCGEGAHPFLFFTLSVAQIVTFIALVSLFLIALRRRFRLRD